MGGDVLWAGILRGFLLVQALSCFIFDDAPETEPVGIMGLQAMLHAGAARNGEGVVDVAGSFDVECCIEAATFNVAVIRDWPVVLVGI